MEKAYNQLTPEERWEYYLKGEEILKQNPEYVYEENNDLFFTNDAPYEVQIYVTFINEIKKILNISIQETEPRKKELKELSEEELDEILLKACDILEENPNLIKFENKRFTCSKDAPYEVQIYTEHRDLKYKMLHNIKTELPYDNSLDITENELDEILLEAIDILLEDSTIVEFKNKKFNCSSSAPDVIKQYVEYRNRKYHYWQELEVEIPEKEVDEISDDDFEISDEEWYEMHKDHEILLEACEIMEENQDFVEKVKGEYICTIDAPYEVHFYVDYKNGFYDIARWI